MSQYRRKKVKDVNEMSHRSPEKDAINPVREETG